MCRSWALPTALTSTGLFLLAVPAIYRQEALGSTLGLMAGLLILIWAMFRGYRDRVLGEHRPAHLLGYLSAFLLLDHMVNLYCFLEIESPVEFPWLSFDLDWFIPGMAAITVVILKAILVSWLVVGFILRCMDTRGSWALAMRIVIYSLPATLLVALPGYESWQPALAAWIVAQAVTLWRIHAEGAFRRLRQI